MPNRAQIEALVIESVQLLAEDFEIKALATLDASTSLYGADAPLDSMALVNLIADIEDAHSEQFDASITLADAVAPQAPPVLTLKPKSPTDLTFLLSPLQIGSIVKLSWLINST